MISHSSSATHSNARTLTRAYTRDLGPLAERGRGNPTPEENAMQTCPGADERRVHALMIAAMCRPGAWTRTPDGRRG